MAVSKIDKRSVLNAKIVELSDITDKDHHVNSFAKSNAITPSNIIGVFVRYDAGYSQVPIVAYYNAASDVLTLRSTYTPTNGAVSLNVLYFTNGQ